MDGFNKKFLLVKPPYEYYPVGLAYVASTLERAGYEYKYVDAGEKIDLKAILTSDEYFAVGSGGLVADFFFLEKFFVEIKEIKPNLPCIIGGHIAKDISSNVLFGKMPIDIAIIGEAEITLPQVLDIIRFKSDDFSSQPGIIYRSTTGQLVKTAKQKRLDLKSERVMPSFTFFDHTTWPVDTKPIPILTGRGCTGCCTFCSPSRRGFMSRNFEDIFSEIDTITNVYKQKSVVFLNEVMFDDDAELISFCNEYKSRFPGLRFDSVLRIDMNTKVLKSLKDAGCESLNIGIESGSDSTLKRMCKLITINDSRHFVEEAKKVGMNKLISGFLFNNEGENETEIEKTLDFHEELKVQSGFNFTIPYPGTAIFKKALRKGIIEDEYKFIQRLPRFYIHQFLTEVLFQYSGQGKPLLPNLTDIPDENFIEVMHHAYLRFNKNYLLNHASIEQVGDALEICGSCPQCGEPFRAKWDPLIPFVRGYVCPNVHNGSCNNCVSYHAHIYSVPALHSYSLEIAEKVAGCRRVVYIGDTYTIKFLLDQGIFNVKFKNVIGFGSFLPYMCGLYLYSDGYYGAKEIGNFTPSSKIYSPEAIAMLKPDAVIIADTTVASSVMRENMIQLGIDAQNIHCCIPRAGIPSLNGFEYWRPVALLPEKTRAICWPCGPTLQCAIDNSVIRQSQVVACVESSGFNALFQRKTAKISEESLQTTLGTEQFDAIITTPESYAQVLVKIRKIPTLCDKTLYCVNLIGNCNTVLYYVSGPINFSVVDIRRPSTHSTLRTHKRKTNILIRIFQIISIAKRAIQTVKARDTISSDLKKSLLRLLPGPIAHLAKRVVRKLFLT